MKNKLNGIGHFTRRMTFYGHIHGLSDHKLAKLKLLATTQKTYRNAMGGTSS